MLRLLFLIQVSRPLVWPVLPTVYYLGMHSAGAELTPAAVAQMVLLTLPMNLLGCGLNDIYDYESDRHCQRRKAIWGATVGEETRRLVWRACLAMTPIVLVGALLTSNGTNIAATCGLVAIAWAYSVPPVRLKERPPLDSLANGAGYFLLPLIMGYSFGAHVSAMPLRYYLLALSVCGIHALATAADYEVDGRARHRTLAVIYGRRVAAAVACGAFFVTWWWGDFRSTVVQAYMGVCLAASLVAVILPRERAIHAACCVIFVGFLIAAALHIFGM